jgi:hypothetical protein
LIPFHKKGRSLAPGGCDAQPPKNSVAICAIAKNEGPYLAEWAIYHKLIGFDQILVFHNDSTDDTAAVLARLQEAGFLTYRDWPSKGEPSWAWLARRLGFRRLASPARWHTQRRAYREGLRILRRTSEWIAFIDLDEFIVLPGLDDIHAFLDRYEAENAIAMNWKIFGTSRRRVKGRGLVIERFLRCARRKSRVNRVVKTLARCSALVDPDLHNHKFAKGVQYRTVSGQLVPPGAGRTNDSARHDVIRIHHYFTKSVQEWKLKVARGRATKPPGHPQKHRTASSFVRNNRNEDVDRYLLKFAPEIRRVLAELKFPKP